MAAMMDADRKAQLERLLDEQRGDMLYDISRARVGLARMESELLRIEDAISELKDEPDDLLH